MTLITDNLLVDIDLTTGTLTDQSGNGNDASFIGTSTELMKGKRGWGYNATGADRLEIAADNAFDIDVFSFYFLIDIDKAFSSSQVLMYKRDISGTQTRWGFFITNSTVITFLNAGTGGNVTFTIAATDYQGAKVMAVTKPTGSTKARLYFDGRFIVESSAVTTLSTTSAEISIGSVGSAPYKDSPISSVLIYSTDHTAAEVVQNCKAIATRVTPDVGNKDFYFPDAAVRSDESNLKSAWIMKNINGVYPDNVDSGGSDMTPALNAGGLVQTTTPWGAPAISLSGGEYLEAADYSEAEDYSTGITIMAWIKTTDNAGELVGHFTNVDPFQGFALAVGSFTNDGKLNFWSADTVATSWDSADTAVNDGIWHRVAISYDNANATFYLDGIADGSPVRTEPAGGFLECNSHRK